MQLPYVVTSTKFAYDKIVGLRVAWTRSAVLESRRTFCRMVYDGVADVVTYHDSRCLSNLIRAIVERVFLTSKFEAVPQPKEGAFKKLMWVSSGVAEKIGRCFPKSRLCFCQAYSGAKRLFYLKALQSFDYSPVIKFADSIIKCFVKVEKTNNSIKSDPAPRLISPRNPRYNIELGKYLKFIEHRVYDAIGWMCGGTTVAKGLNAYRRGKLIHNKWKKFTNPVAVGLDASRFDQHCSVEALQFEHSLYLQLFPHDETLKFLLELQLSTTAVGYARDGKVRYTKRGGRCSGDVNTSLGNCFISCALLMQYCKEVNIPTVFINDGDDSVLFLEAENLPKLANLEAWFLNYGFTMKVEEPAYVVEQVEFCQCKPVLNTNGEYTMVRNIRKALEHDLVSNKVRNSKDASAHCAAIKEAGLSLNSGIPVMQSFYQALPDHKTKARLPEYGFRKMVEGMESKIERVTAQSRASFYKAFGITPDSQEHLEHHFCRKIDSSINSKIPGEYTATALKHYPRTRTTLSCYNH